MTMVCYTKCINVIDEENEQYYVTGDMGPQIISLLEQKLGHQVINKMIPDTTYHRLTLDALIMIIGFILS